MVVEDEYDLGVLEKAVAVRLAGGAAVAAEEHHAVAEIARLLRREEMSASSPNVLSKGTGLSFLSFPYSDIVMFFSQIYIFSLS